MTLPLTQRLLLQTREQIQQDLLTLIDSDDQELNDKICQIVVDNFDKFFTEVKWNPHKLFTFILLSLDWWGLMYFLLKGINNCMIPLINFKGREFQTLWLRMKRFALLWKYGIQIVK